MVQASRICANCGTSNAPNEQFCANCGYSLLNTSTQQTIVNTPSFSSPTPSLPTAIAPSTVQGPIPAPSMPATGAVPSRRQVTGALASGTLLYRRYRVVQLVGRGGFGAVYKAYDEHFTVQRSVAVKEMSDAQLNPTEKAQAIKEFRQEAELLVPLQHINLPDIKDFFEENGKAYLVMEFIEGETLEKQQDDANGPLPENLVMGYALQLCDVLNYLHTQPQPIIFRDLKPSNIMVTKQGRIKLIDFGIARVFKATATKDTSSLGSRGYAPLEQYGRGQTDVRSDIYALGATLYDLLTKTTPTDAVTRKVNPSLFETPRQLNPQISIATERIVLKAMAEEPKDRYQSAQDMYQDIVASGFVTKTAIGSINMPPSIALASTMPSVQATAVPPINPVLPPTMQTTVSPASPAPPAFNPAPGPPQAPQQKRRFSRRGFIIGGGVVVLAAAGAYAVGNHFLSTAPTAAPSTGTVTIKFGYSTEKDAWLQAAIQSFHQSKAATLAGSTKTIQIVTDNSGSLDVGDKILSGEDQFVAWSPASDVELNRLNYKWRQAHSGQDIIGSSSDLAPQSLVSSPLIFAVWQDRANAMLNTYQTIDWPSIHTALLLKNGWSDLGHPEWGSSIFLGHTLPDQSNSGLLSITLMAYAYAKTIGQSRLTLDMVNSPALWNYVQVFENAVNGFGRSSGTFMRRVINEGPASYAITTIYENLVLMLQQDASLRGKEPLQLFYPSLNTVSNHPFAILQAPWTTTEQQKAAGQFRDFLLAREQQKQALQFGFRPSDPSISLTDSSVSNNPFKFLQQGQLSPKHSLDQAIEPQAEVPSGDVVEALITQWEKYYPNPQIVS